jgi:thymidylate synthase
MHVIRTRNVQEALPKALVDLDQVGIDRESRNGPVRLFPGPVTTVYEEPCERVIYYPERDANPFFHLFESLWMLAGRNDVKYVAHFVKRMKTFSDDGKTLHGAYGARWLKWFQQQTPDGEGFMLQDQLLDVIEALKHNPDDRRQVISMWDGHVDPPTARAGGKDVPCNTHIYVSVSTEGRLDMTLCNRSNDVVWGAYGANAVHFSYLQEFLAAGVGVPVGRLYQMSNNLHAYHATLEQVQPILQRVPYNPYAEGLVEPYPLVSTNIKQWREDLSVFLDVGPTPGLRDPFFRRVAIPMWLAHQAYKESDDLERFELAFENLSQCHAADWRVACQEWLERRRDAQAKREEEAEA